MFDDMRGGVFGCWRQGIKETWSAADQRSMLSAQRAELARQIEAATRERQAAQRQEWATNAKRNADLWGQCSLVTKGDPVALYMKRRELADMWPLPKCLRLHPALTYWRDGVKIGTFPAMVAPLTAPDGRVVALHRTYLTQDGRKADVPEVKKLTGTAGPLAGASIRLHAPVSGALGIAEGIETALAASLASGVPTVAAYCAGNLAAWQWPAGVRRIVIFADADRAGREAADTLRARAMASRVRCDLLTPSGDGDDWCDVWANRDLIEASA
jgi:putative DNA primase/helicase